MDVSAYIEDMSELRIGIYGKFGDVESRDDFAGPRCLVLVIFLHGDYWLRRLGGISHRD